MNISFFTEGNLHTKVPRTYANMRTDMAWRCALNADHHSIYDYNVRDTYDLGIVIIPKKNPIFEIDHIRNVCTKIAVMQEGPFWFWQDWPLVYQFQYIKLLSNVDIIYVHNQVDLNYYSGLISGKDVRILPSLMIEDAIDKSTLTVDPMARSGVMIGGNFVSWYGGADSYIIARQFDTQIYAPSMGRKQSDEDRIEDIAYLPYLTWSDWIDELSKRKYAVHLMRTHAAGTFALNCAYLGIPCIGYSGLDTQSKLHPLTTVHDGDLATARELAQLLLIEPEFYETCSTRAKYLYEEYYSESTFLKGFAP